MPEYRYVAQEEENKTEHNNLIATEIMGADEMRYSDSWQRRYTLILYSMTTVLLFADQNLLAPNLSAAADEFGFDNNQRDKKLGGDIALAFFILGAPASFVVGCAADSDYLPRSFLFGLTVLIGEGACFLTYFTKSYAGLYVTRALTGFSVGGALPLLSSVLGDWFPPGERSKVMASVGIGTGLGIALGQGISGFMGPIYGWRSPFLVVSLPALIIAVLVMTTVKDPERGASEIARLDVVDQYESNETEQAPHLSNPVDNDSAGSPTDRSDSLNDNAGVKMELNFQLLLSWIKPSSYASHFQTTKELFQTKTVVLTLIQGAPGCVPWGIVNTFLNDYLSEDCGLSVQEATTLILMFGLGNFFGMVIGGAGGDVLYKKDSRYPVILSGTMAILGCIPLWVLVNTIYIDEDDYITIATAVKTGTIALLAGIGSGVTGPIVKATLQNVTLPTARGQAFAFLNTFDDFGRGLGPVFVAALIVGLGGRQAAFNVGITGWILCGFFNCCMFWTIEGDEKRIKSKLSELSSTQHGASAEPIDTGTSS